VAKDGVKAAAAKDGIIIIPPCKALTVKVAENYILAALTTDTASGKDNIITIAAINWGEPSVVYDEVVAFCCGNGCAICRFPDDGLAINDESPSATAAPKT
jgi:glycerate-2-kinase